MLRALLHLVDADESDVGLFPIADHFVFIAMQWGDLIGNFGLDELLIVDQTAEQQAASVPPGHPVGWRRFESLAEAEAAYRDMTWVYFEHGGEPLDTFEHPVGDVIYAFGPDTTGFAREPGKTYVEIPGVRRHGFFSPMAAAIALYDRARRRT